MVHPPQNIGDEVCKQYNYTRTLVAVIFSFTFSINQVTAPILKNLTTSNHQSGHDNDCLSSGWNMSVDSIMHSLAVINISFPKSDKRMPSFQKRLPVVL